ncbi:conserved archaeal membrane protein [Acidianus two-tailed virus 2]|nr:conserved archaeal membrane protein [Acidianus two-tailed virus 2]
MVSTSPPPTLTNSVQPHHTVTTTSIPLPATTLISVILASALIAFLLIFLLRRTSKKQPDPYLAVTLAISRYIRKKKAIALVFYIDTTDQRLKIYPVVQKVSNVLIYLNENGETNFSVIDPKTKPLQIKVGNISYPTYFAIAGNTIKYLAKFEDLETGVKYDNISVDDPRLIEILSKITGDVVSTYFVTPTKKLTILASPEAIASVTIKRIWSPIENSIITIKEINENITKLMEISARVLGLRLNSRITLIVLIIAVFLIIMVLLGTGVVHFPPPKK